MELLTLQEVAKELKLTERTVYRYVVDGKLKAQKIANGRWRILREDLDAFISGKMGNEGE